MASAGSVWTGTKAPEIGGPHGPYYQSQKLARYQEAVSATAREGARVLGLRQARGDEGRDGTGREGETRPKIYSRKWMAETDADRKRFEAEGRTGAVKVKMPREGACRFFDHIRGDMAVDWATEQDTVIQRSDGTVTYNLANVVDDFDMKITPRDPGRGAPVEHPAADLHAGRAGLPAAGVCPRPVRGRTGQQEQAQQAEDRAVPEEPRLQEGVRPREGDRRPDRRARGAGVVQPGAGRLLRAGRLPAGRGAELPRAPRLGDRRQPGGIHPRGDGPRVFRWSG